MKMCISANGPIYFADMNCPSDKDFLQKPFDDSWTGVSAFWSDMAPASSQLSRQEGGNIYFRRTDSLSFTTPKKIEDLKRTMSLTRSNSLSTSQVVDVITFHRMSSSNDIFACHTGNTFQYVISYTSGADPIIVFNYGDFDWIPPHTTIGWNSENLPEPGHFDFTTHFGSKEHLLGSTIVCTNSTNCRVSACQHTKIYDANLKRTRCTSDREEISRSGKLVVQKFFQVALEGCTSFTAEELDNFLHLAFEYISDVEVTVLPENFVECVNDRSLINFSVRTEISLTSTSAQSVEELIDFEYSGYFAAAIIAGLTSMSLSTSYNIVERPEYTNYDGYSTLDGTSLDGYYDMLEANSGTFVNIDLESLIIRNTEFTLTCGFGETKLDGDCLPLNECMFQGLNPELEDVQLCTHGVCKDLPMGYTCECEPGKIISPDVGSYETGYTCEIANECELGLHNCESLIQTCIDTEAGFDCVCAPGFVETLPGKCELFLEEEHHFQMAESRQVFGMLEQVLDQKFGLVQFDGLVAKLKHYGCWCTTLDNPKLAKRGLTVDRIDDLCRRRSKCARCLKTIDGTCKMTQEDYVMVFDRRSSELKCMGDPSSCEFNACECEREFIEQVTSQLAKGLLDDDNLNILDDQTCSKIKTGGGITCQDDFPRMHEIFGT